MKRLILLLAGAVAFVIPSFAHDPGLSSAVLVRTAKSIDAELTFSRAEMNASAMASELLDIEARGEDIKAASEAVTVDDANNIHFHLSYPVRSSETVTLRAPILRDLARGHRQFVSVRDEAGDVLGEKVLGGEIDSFELDARPARPLFSDFFVMGIWHILTGYDHLLFLFGLLLVGANFRSTLVTISCFTLAHSITLALATFQIVELPSRVVEPLIAASIAYVGLENIFARDCARWRGYLTFALGLIHGLGFAGALREMGVAAGGWEVVVPLLGFNLGVEIGQLGIALVVLPALILFRRREVFALRVAPACSVLVALAGAYWLVERTLF